MKKKGITDTHETDVLIAGAGMAGYAAAMAAAEAGKRVTILEKQDIPGGAATLSNVGTLCGLYYRGPQPIPVPHPRCISLMDKLTRVYPQTKILSLPEGLHVIAYDKTGLNRTLKDHLLENNIQLIFGAQVTDVQTDNQKITAVTFLNDSQQHSIHSKAFIDCTGSGSLARLVKHPMLQTRSYQAAAQIIRFQNVKATTEYALNLSLRKVMHETLEQETWPPAYMRLSVVPGSLRNNTFDLKLPLTEPITDDEALTERLKAEVEMNLPRIVAIFNKVESLAQASVAEIAPIPGVRLQQRPQGQYILTHDDVIRCTKPEDGVALGTWPIEEWDYDGKVNMEYFAEDDGYLIPARCLQSPMFQNLYFGGKGISADDKAIASARVTGTCLQTGYAAGKLAACDHERDQEEIIRALRTTLIHKP
jgi:2-polyprenyl-6-methoxyphenol hydroxylase-like FAD-dependent oxidoreductase